MAISEKERRVLEVANTWINAKKIKKIKTKAPFKNDSLQ